MTKAALSGHFSSLSHLSILSSLGFRHSSFSLARPVGCSGLGGVNKLRWQDDARILAVGKAAREAGSS
jgi:hypothetical protein